jgi:hypothetical protein
MLNLATYQLNEKELSLKEEFPDQYKKTIELALLAESEIYFRYTTDNDDENNNAFLHSYWSALMTKNIDSSWAKKFSDAHESNSLETLSSQMDLYNNKIGIDEAVKNKHLSNEELAWKIQELLNNGLLRKIHNGKLIKTDVKGRREFSIFDAIYKRVLSIIIELIATNKINYKNDDGDNPLIYASHTQYFEAVQRLIKHFQIDDTNNQKETALIQSVKSSNLDVVKLILNQGANPNHQDINGQTPLLVACAFLQSENMKILLNCGAKRDLVDKKGRTALDLANGINFKQGIEILS